MGSARDSAPDSNHTRGMARSSVPMRLRSRPPSAPASASSRQSSRAILPAVYRVTPRAIVSGNGRPPAQQPKLLDRLRDALRARHYSPRTEQGYRRTMLPVAVKGPLWEHLVRVRQIYQQDLTERYGSGLAGNLLRPLLRLTTAPSPLLLVAFIPLTTWRLRLTLGQFGGHGRKPDNP